MTLLDRTSPRIGFAAAVLLILAGCGTTPAPSSLAIAPEAVWDALERPRPEPLDGAVRLGVSELVVLTDAWSGSEAVSTNLGLQELVAAGLLRRRDVRYVERRRFAAAVERERQGLPRTRNEPAAGNSQGAAMLLTGTWAATGSGATLALRLVDAETGDLIDGWRTETPQGADPTSVARRIVGSLLVRLEALGRLPEWDDPVAGSAPESWANSGIPVGAAMAFFRGLAAEERWEWESARRGYQQALEVAPGFFEAEAALARAARLRNGGTLGGSSPDA